MQDRGILLKFNYKGKGEDSLTSCVYNQNNSSVTSFYSEKRLGTCVSVSVCV